MLYRGSCYLTCASALKGFPCPVRLSQMSFEMPSMPQERLSTTQLESFKGICTPIHGFCEKAKKRE